MTERRYSEDEVAAIFERATQVEPGPEQLTAGDSGGAGATGLTLAEIQRIGGEVGISPDVLEASARALSTPSDPPVVNRTWLGFPLGVAASAPLPRRLTDEEWAQLVVLIRERFSAHGTLDDAGALKSWRNGNLRVQLEPTADGHRIRMQTYKQSSAQLMRVGVGMFGMSVVLGGISLLTGSVDAAIGSFGTLAIIGAGFLGANALSLPGWAAARKAQMAEIAERAMDLASRGLPAGEATGSIGAGDASDHRDPGTND